MRNRLPPLLPHLLTPTLQLRDEDGDLRVLLDALRSNFRRVVVAELRIRQLLNRMIGVRVDALAEFLEHFDGRE